MDSIVHRLREIRGVERIKIDRQIADLSRLLGFGISLALQPRMTVAELELLLG